MDEETALKAAGVKTFVGSIPTASAKIWRNNQDGQGV
jgi:hypothetical protein